MNYTALVCSPKGFHRLNLRSIFVLPNNYMASTFSWWWSLSSSLRAYLLISLTKNPIPGPYKNPCVWRIKERWLYFSTPYSGIFEATLCDYGWHNPKVEYYKFLLALGLVCTAEAFCRLSERSVPSTSLDRTVLQSRSLLFFTRTLQRSLAFQSVRHSKIFGFVYVSYCLVV